MARCAAPVQLPSGSWNIRWVDASGRRRSATFASHNEARQELARRQIEAVEVRRGERAAPPPRKTFAELADHWLATKGAEKRSPKDDASILRCHLAPAFGNLALTEISYERVEAFKASRSHLARQTVRNLLNLLGAMLKHARKLGWLRPDQVPAIDRPSAVADERAFCYLRTEQEVQRFLRAAREHGDDVFTLYAVAVYTGMRQGEIAALAWDRVNWQTRLIAVDRSFQGPTKTGRLRHVPILDPLLPLLRAWRLRNPGPLLFPNANGKLHQPCARIFVERFHAVLDAAGFERPKHAKGKQVHYIHFHDLRHTFASHWMMNGGDLFKLQKILGHQSADMTQRYAHLSPAAFAGDFGRFNALAVAGGDGEVVPFDFAGRQRRKGGAMEKAA